MVPKPSPFKQRISRMMNKTENKDIAGKVFSWSIIVLIALSIISIILESFNDINAKYHTAFEVFEIITVVVFTIEYLLRIWTADLLYPDARYPRLKYIFSFMAIIDLLAILPFYLPFISADLRFLRMIRLFRLFRLLRVFKLSRYFEALQIIVRVIRSSSAQLIMAFTICFFVILFSAIVMYTVENPAQPEQFPNVISSLWWALCTLTTVGYGDVYPVTHIGKFLASIISLVGIGIIAIPTGIIAAGFNQVVIKEKKNKNAEKKEKVIPPIDEMTDEELIALQEKIEKKLNENNK